VNSYRLLKASLTGAERTAFGVHDDALAGLATPMLMLAVVTGAPRLAAGFLALPEDDGTSLIDHLRGLTQALDEGPLANDTRRRVREFCESNQRPLWRAPVARTVATAWATRVAQFAFEDLSAPQHAAAIAQPREGPGRVAPADTPPSLLHQPPAAEPNLTDSA
jgi:hypothetical protein